MYYYFRILSIYSPLNLLLAYDESTEKTRFTKSFRKSNINASVQTPNAHEGIATSPARIFFFFGEVGFAGKRNDVPCKLFRQMT